MKRRNRCSSCQYRAKKPSKLNSHVDSKNGRVRIANPEWLPDGWIAQTRMRVKGITAGTFDKYYTEEETGRCFRSKCQVRDYLAAKELGQHCTCSALNRNSVDDQSMLKKIKREIPESSSGNPDILELEKTNKKTSESASGNSTIFELKKPKEETPVAFSGNPNIVEEHAPNSPSLRNESIQEETVDHKQLEDIAVMIVDKDTNSAIASIGVVSCNSKDLAHLQNQYVTFRGQEKAIYYLILDSKAIKEMDQMFQNLV